MKLPTLIRLAPWMVMNILPLLLLGTLVTAHSVHPFGSGSRSSGSSSSSDREDWDFAPLDFLQQLPLSAGPLASYRHLDHAEIHPIPHVQRQLLKRFHERQTMAKNTTYLDDPWMAFAGSLSISPRVSPSSTSYSSSTSPSSTSSTISVLPSPDDTFLLKLHAFDQTFYLHLEPNQHLIHPQAAVEIHRNGKLHRIIHSTSSVHRLYKGRVLRKEHSLDIFEHGTESPYLAPFEDSHPDDLGWARFTFHDLDQHQGPMSE